MFTQYIHGAPALQLEREIRLGKGELPNDHLWEQIADIQVQLANLKLDGIGGIYEEGDEFKLGSEMRTGKGPFRTSGHYYSALAEHEYELAQHEAETDFKDDDCVNLPYKFQALVQHRGLGDQTGPFGVMNRSLSPGSILVDHDMNIVGLVSFKRVLAAPTTSLTKLPMQMGMYLLVPDRFNSLRRQPVIHSEIATLITKYIGFMRAAIIKHNTNNQTVIDVVNSMMADEPYIMEGLDNYKMYHDVESDDWMNFYAELLGEEMEVVQDVVGGRWRRRVDDDENQE